MGKSALEKRSTSSRTPPATPPARTTASAPPAATPCAHDWSPTGHETNGVFHQDGPWTCGHCDERRETLAIADVPGRWMRGHMAKAAVLRVDDSAPLRVPVLSPRRPDDLLRLGDVAREYNIAERTVRDWIQKGLIPYVMVGPFRIKYVERATVETRIPARGESS
jgi:hypothetical protein